MDTLHKLNHKLSTTQVIALGFFCAILIGSFFLILPISSADGQFTSFIDSLFTSTTSVCVTGLVVVPTFSHWSIFGKIVILILIQLGGIGIISFTTGIMMILGSRITLSDRMLLEDALNLNSLQGLVKFLRRIFKGTFVIETIGAICYSFVFIPDFGLLHGICYSIFHSISAFCNAGIDLLGNNSLVPYSNNLWINLVTMLLIIFGGIGFIVWWDILSNIKKIWKHEFTFKKAVKKLRIHSKIALISTLLLIFIGAILIFFLEYTNNNTIGKMSIPHKILASFFQSVTLRTAGFMTFSQSSLRSTSILICLFLMFIGGSPIGTAGGVKTTTVTFLFLSTMATIKGKHHLVIFNRTIPHRTIQKALAVTVVSLSFLMLATFALHLTERGSLLDATYEVTSALATVGLSRDFTSTLHLTGKIIIICCMYLGRIGPISMMIFFNRPHKDNNLLSYPYEDISVG